MHVLAQAVASKNVVIEKHYLGNLRNPWAIFKAPTVVRNISGHFDIVHAQFGSACGLTSSVGNSRRILTLRGSDWYFLTEGPLPHRLHGRLAHGMTRASLNRYDRIIVMSDRMKVDVARYIGDSRINVIPDGIDLGRFVPIDQETARSALGAEGDRRPWVLFPTLQANNPIKRPLLAAEAFRRLKVKLPDAKFVLVSKFPHERMPLLLNAGSVLLLTSTHEGWPNIIKEALACNIPFVSTDVSDLRKISDYESSCAVVAAEPDALAKALRNAIEMPRSETLRDHVVGMDKHVIATNIRALYKEVLDG